MGTRILVIEDEPGIAEPLVAHLGREGFEATAVGTVADARATFDDAPPAVVILDVMLPDGDGFDILGKLRARPEFAMLPIVLLTVKAELANIRNGLALGADGYITKPYSKNQLAEVIGRVLKHP